MRIRPSSHEWLVLLLAFAGCSRGPARIDAPEIHPEAAAGKALELYDSNHDGRLNKTELARCPGVLEMVSLYDQNGDGSVDREEFVNRLNELFETRVGLTQLRARVTYQGRPLSDATVVFEPEPYLGSDLKPAEGVTNSKGSAQLSIAVDELPEQVKHLKAMQCGTYKVRITHPKIKLPPKYNTDTTLGFETKLGAAFATFNLNAR